MVVTLKDSVRKSLGVMQGRLSDQIDQKIQAFPWPTWQNEFSAAAELNIRLIEWTLDQEGLHDNPILTKKGQDETNTLIKAMNVTVPSLTGDCFMQAPFFKSTGLERSALLDDFKTIVRNIPQIGCQLIIFPLVDDGSIENTEQQKILIGTLCDLESFLLDNNVRIAFESDYGPQELAAFIGQFPSEVFGINYDTGNSAALGYDASEEFACYGQHITNVHIKDRAFKGTTVPLGEGDADFETIFGHLNGMGYSGNMIMQAARAIDGDHAAAIMNYQNFIHEHWEKVGSRP